MIGTYVKQEALLLNTGKFNPVLSNLEDNISSYKFIFTVKESHDIIVTHTDMDIIKYDLVIGNRAKLAREEFNKLIFQTAKQDKIDDKVNLFMPVCEEIKTKLNEIVHDLMIPETFMLVNAKYLMSLYSPWISYNLTKLIVEKLKENNKTIPFDLDAAIKKPEFHFKY